MKHRKKLRPLYFSTLQIHIVCSLKSSKWFFYLWNGNRWSPLKKNGKRNVSKISFFVATWIRAIRHWRFKWKTQLKFQGTLHPNKGEVFLFYFPLDWTLVTRPAGRRRCMVAASKTEIIIMLQLLEANLVNFRSKLRKLRSRNGKTLLFLNCAQRCRKKCNSQHEQKRLGLTSVMPVN